jgi:hypothetical protein
MVPHIVDGDRGRAAAERPDRRRDQKDEVAGTEGTRRSPRCLEHALAAGDQAEQRAVVAGIADSPVAGRVPVLPQKRAGRSKAMS